MSDDSNVIHVEMVLFIGRRKAWPVEELTDSSSLQKKLCTMVSFILSTSEQRSAAQIDGAMSHLTGRLPPRCTQSHAPISPGVLLESQCHQNRRQDEKFVHLSSAEIHHFFHMQHKPNVYGDIMMNVEKTLPLNASYQHQIYVILMLWLTDSLFNL